MKYSLTETTLEYAFKRITVCLRVCVSGLLGIFHFLLFLSLLSAGPFQTLAH